MFAGMRGRILSGLAAGIAILIPAASGQRPGAGPGTAGGPSGNLPRTAPGQTQGPDGWTR